MIIETVVRRIDKEADEIARIELVAAGGGPLPPFSAGAHIDVHIADGLVRQYSLCNAPRENHRYVIGVLRDPQSRGGSAALHDRLAEGDRLTIGEPRNLFPLREAADHSILFAGGIGITPLLAMAERLTSLNRSFELHYCGRGLSRMAFLRRIAESPFAERVRLYPDDARDGSRLHLDAILARPAAGVHAYVCGPRGFMDHVLDRAAGFGWPDERLHREYFGAAASVSDGDSAFEVEIASTGQVIPVAAEQSVAVALAARGIVIPTSCEQGVCGTCATPVVAGLPDHRDSFLTDEERHSNTLFLPCCSRALTARLVLDL